MALHLIALALLVAAFVVATLTPLNLGALALVATFCIGVVWLDMSSAELYEGFPGNLFVVLVGVTYLFNVAKANGTIDWMMDGVVRLVGGRVWLIPWIMFAASGLFSGIGALFSVPIVAPIALAFAARNRISQLYMGLMVIHGTCAGCLAPISVYGVIVTGILESNGFQPEPMKVFGIALVTNVVIAIIITFIYGRKKVDTEASEAGGLADGTTTPSSGGSPATARAGSPTPGGGSAAASAGGAVASPAAGGGTATLERPSGGGARKASVTNWATVAAIATLVIAGVAFSLDIGLLAITLCIALAVVGTEYHKQAIAEIPWSVVLLVCGVLTYVGVLQHAGTVDFLGDGVAGIGIPLLAALALAYVGGIVSAFATSSGVLAALIPLAIPLLDAGALVPVTLVAVIAVASTVVDVSPFSTHGAIVVANTTSDQREYVLRGLLRYAIFVVALAPLLLWAVFIVPGI